MKRAKRHTSFTVPSQEEEMNWSLLMLDQSTEKTSRVCSCHARMGKSYMRLRHLGSREQNMHTEGRHTLIMISHNFSDPSPETVASWFS